MLFSSSLVLALVASLASVQAAPTVTTPGPVPIVSNAPAIAESIYNSPSVDDRFKKLLTDSSGKLLTGAALRQLTVFDYNQQEEGGNGGSILLATVDNFPILEHLGIAAAISFVEPCGLNIPHSHPRASEFFLNIDGILNTGFVQENGFNTEIETQLGKYQGTVFPMGSIHYQQNPTCKPAVFVAALNNEDPGRSDVATNFFMLPSEVIDAALGFPHKIGGSNIDAWRSHLPKNLAAGIDSCLSACGLSEPGDGDDDGDGDGDDDDDGDDDRSAASSSTVKVPAASSAAASTSVSAAGPTASASASAASSVAASATPTA